MFQRCAFLVLVASVACTGAPEVAGNVRVSVAGLTIDDVTDACYDITVANAAGVVIWEQAGLCSNTYGDGQGSISYVGPCDASVGANPNSVTLELVKLVDTAGADMTGYANPCPPGAGCKQSVACVENADTPVTFDLTVALDADQGFLDVAVNLDAMSCAAKYDCAAAGPLVDPATGDGVATSTLAISCGDPSKDLTVYMTDVLVECTDVNNATTTVVTIDPSNGPGNHFGAAQAPAGVVQAATHVVASTIGIVPDEVDNLSLAVLVALDMNNILGRGDWQSCAIRARATGTDAPIAGGQLPANQPLVEWSVPIVERVAGVEQLVDCFPQGIRSNLDGVKVIFPTTPTNFPNSFATP